MTTVTLERHLDLPSTPRDFAGSAHPAITVASPPAPPAAATVLHPVVQPVVDPVVDPVDVWGIDSFPASDPPANW
jgi:hypothetical protein